jgi:hypothetical protein
VIEMAGPYGVLLLSSRCGTSDAQRVRAESALEGKMFVDEIIKRQPDEKENEGT